MKWNASFMSPDDAQGISSFLRLTMRLSMRLSMGFAVLVAAVLSCSLLSSCEKAIMNDDDTVVTDKEMGELYVACSFSQSQSEMTRAASVPLAECASRVQYVIMKEGSIVYSSEQVNGGGNSFGTLSVNLEPGTYRLMVLAHNERNGNAVSVGSDAFFQGYNGRATESFSYSDEVVVVKNKRKAVNCKLSRCVALVSFSSDDVIPAEVSKFRLSLTGVSSKYDMRNQIGVDAATYSTAMVNMNNWKSSAGLMTNVESFVFLPAVESVVNAKFEFFNSADELVLMRNIENIRMRINSKTSVSGSFFQADGMEASMIVNTDWGEEISINAND